jgi:hypothetical protein
MESGAAGILIAPNDLTFSHRVRRPSRRRTQTNDRKGCRAMAQAARHTGVAKTRVSRRSGTRRSPPICFFPRAFWYTYSSSSRPCSSWYT